MQSNESRLTRRDLGMICAAQIVGAATMHSAAFAGDGLYRCGDRIGKLNLTKADSVSKYESIWHNADLAAGLTLLKTGKRSPDTAKLKIRLNIEYKEKGVSIYDKTLGYSFRGRRLQTASGWGEPDEHVILIDYPRLKDYLYGGEAYIFTVTTVVPIPSKGFGEQFLSTFSICK